jgi:hypothetical protein
VHRDTLRELVFLHLVGSVGHIVHSSAVRAQNVDTLFLLGWDRYGFIKKHTMTRYTELVFLYSVGSVGHVVHFGASEPRNIDTQFTIFHAIVGLVQIQQKRIGTYYAELVFLHPVGSAGHVVHSGASGPRNIEALFSWSGGPSTDSLKSTSRHITPNLSFCICRICRSRSAFQCVRGVNLRCTIF